MKKTDETKKQKLLEELGKMSNKELMDELADMQELASLILPRKKNYPKLPNLDYYVGTNPYQGLVAGDLPIIINFNEFNLEKKIEKAIGEGNVKLADTLKLNYDRFGVLIADVRGHNMSASIMLMHLYAAVKMAISYDLELHGQATRGFLEKYNTFYYNLINGVNMKQRPYMTLIYAEFLNDGRIRIIRAGHPAMVVFSNKNNRIEKLADQYTAGSTIVGLMPSRFHADMEHFEPAFATKEEYPVPEVHLQGQGDIVVMYSDGLSEQDGGARNFVAEGLEPLLQKHKHERAKTIYHTIMDALPKYNPDDDVTIAVVKRKI